VILPTTLSICSIPHRSLHVQISAAAGHQSPFVVVVCFFFFCCFFFGWEGDTFLHSGQKSENEQAIKAAKSGREGIYFYFSKN
jgi:hypothetical protein